MSRRSSRAMVLERPGLFVETSFPLPAVDDHSFLLRVELVTICGGDLIEYAGKNRKAKYPLLMGHELVGRIEEIGAAAASTHGIERGSRVMVEPYIRCGSCPACTRGLYHFCREGRTYGVTVSCAEPPFLWGAYSQFLYGTAGAVVHRIADEVPAPAACLTTVLGNAVRWIRTRGEAQVGEPVLVLGLGVQGLSSVLLAREAGLRPIVVLARERAGRRLDLAREFGADAIVDSADPDARSSVRIALDGRPLALAIECTGAEPMIGAAVEALEPGGRLVLVGTRGGEPARFDVDSIVFKELDVLGGLGQANDTQLAAEIVNSCRYRVEEMVSHTFPLREVDEAIQRFRAGGDDVIHVALDPWDGW